MNHNAKLMTSICSALMAAVASVYGQTSSAPFIGGQDGTQPDSAAYGFLNLDYPGSTATYAYAINDKGEAVGWYTGGGCTQSACSFTYSKGTYASFECVLENATEAFDISNKGEVVGAYSYFGGVNAFIWEGNNSCTTVPAPTSSSLVEATGVNDQGVVVGFYQNSSGDLEGFRYANGKSNTISCPNAADTEVWGIADNGVIVGAYANSTNGPWTGFTYEKGVCTNVECSSLDVSSLKAISMNKSGQISGWFTDTGGVNHGFVQTAGACTQVDHSTATGTLLLHMNDEGNAAGFYASATSGALLGTVAIPKQ